MAAPARDQEDIPGRPESESRRKEQRDDRSLSPRGDERQRGRSPRRRLEDVKLRRKDAGFKWKEKRRDDVDGRNGEQDQGLRRGYKDHYRPRSRSPPRTVEKATVAQVPEKKDKKEKKEKKSRSSSGSCGTNDHCESQ